MFSSSLPVTQKWDLDTKVEAKAKGWKKFYWGRVTAFDTKDGTYTITFDDGEVKTGVKEYNIKGPKKVETFKAPDGKEFQDRQEYRQYLAETMYSFKNLTDQSLSKLPGEIDGQTFNIVNLKSCEVRLMDHSDQVLIDGIENCKVLVGPSCESVFVRNATNCTLFIACKQFRSRDCKDVTISLYTKTEPIVETSTNIRFYPYSCAYPGQSLHFEKARLIPDHNHWCNVFDFNAGDTSIPMPHWSLIPESEGWPEWQIPLEGTPGVENPVPKDARAVPMEKEQCFGFGLTQDQAQQAISNQTSPTSDMIPQQEQQPAPAVPDVPSNPIPKEEQKHQEKKQTKLSTAAPIPTNFKLESCAGKVAVITGGASGIGLAIARKCALAGMKIAIADVDDEAIVEATKELKTLTNYVLISKVDVSQPSQVIEFEATVRRTFEGDAISFVLNNAGVMSGMSILNASTKETKALLDINVAGVIFVFQVFVPSVAKQGSPCTFVTTSSVAGLVPVPCGMYTASKHAVTGLTECIAKEVAIMPGGENISIHLLCPSFVSTAMWTKPILSTDPQTKLVRTAIHQVVSKKGLSATQVAEKLFEGLSKNQFAILVDNPGGEGELANMVVTHAKELSQGLATKPVMGMQKLSRDIQQAVEGQSSS